MRALLSPAAWLVLVSSVASVTLACGPRYLRSDDFAAEQRVPSAGITRNVVLVSIDGLRPDAIARFTAPTLQRLHKVTAKVTA